MRGRNLIISKRSSRGNSGECFDGAIIVNSGLGKDDKHIYCGFLLALCHSRKGCELGSTETFVTPHLSESLFENTEARSIVCGTQYIYTIGLPTT